MSQHIKIKGNMTSTSFNVGLTDNTRASSRVLRPPGGGHTDIFGGEPEQPRGRRPAPNPNANRGEIANGAERDLAVQNGQEPKAAPQPQEPPPMPQQAPEKPQAESPQIEMPHVEKPHVEKPQTLGLKSDNPKVVTPTEPRADAPKRVRVPPGGFSSGLW